MFSVLASSMGRRGDSLLPGPNLLDGTRAMELTEATVRSLRRGRTVDLHYEPISEEANFKSIMTSTGCLILLGSLLALMIAMAGPPLGLRWTLFIPYAIPPLLAVFIVMQTLRLALQRRPAGSEGLKRGPSHPKPARIGDDVS
jgi:myo-inositol 2-dehydrogenase/D-chiro-inositol 1-dehydrogenase